MTTVPVSTSLDSNSDSSATNSDPNPVSTAAIAAPEKRSTETGDPLVLGLPLISVGAVVLGLQQVGYVNNASVGSPLAVILAAGGLGLLVATIWATRLDVSPASSPWNTGRSLVTITLGALAGFFLSYGALVLGLLHSWYGIRPGDVAHTEAAYQIAWLVVFVVLALASVRLPLLFTVLFAAFSVTLILLLIGTLGPSQGAAKAAGVIILIIAASAAYVFLAVASVVSGGREYPLGRALLK